jgi:hypothetical protein
MSAKRKRKFDLWEFIEKLAIALAPALFAFLLQRFWR